MNQQTGLKELTREFFVIQSKVSGHYFCGFDREKGAARFSPDINDAKLNNQKRDNIRQDERIVRVIVHISRIEVKPRAPRVNEHEQGA